MSGNCTGNYSISGRNCSGTDGNAYNTVSSGISSSTAGDTIYIRDGTYVITSTVNVNFSSDSTTTIQGYGSETVTLSNNSDPSMTIFNLGATSKNILFKNLKFTGTLYKLITGWTNYSGNVWTASAICSTQIRFDTTNGTEVASIVLVNSANKYYCSAGIIYAYSTSDPTTAYTSPGINTADDFSGIAIGNSSVNVAGQLITVDNCDFQNFSHAGIKGTWRWHILNSKFNNIGTDGHDHDVYDGGVQTSGNESIYEYNYFGYTPGAGIHFYTSPAYAIVRYNVFNGLSGSNLGSYGLLVAGSNIKIYNNTFYGWSNGVNLFRSGSQNNDIKNNVFSNNTSDLAIDTGGGYPTNNTFTKNYLGSNTKCTGCSDYTGSGGPNLTTLASATNTYSTSPWTHFSYNFTANTNISSYLQFFNACSNGASPSIGVWYLDDISIVPSGGGAELVQNGGMEGTYTNGVAPHWASCGSNCSQENTIVHSGSSSQKVNIPAGCGARIESNDYISLNSGNYIFSGWAKRDSGTGTLPVYIAGVGLASFTIGALGPSFLGNLPYSSATDFKVDPADADFSLVTDVGQNLGASYQLGLNSALTSWPLGTINQNYFGSGWDLGAFVYNSDSTAPTTTDNVDTSWHNSNVTITLICSDGGSGCANTYYTTDGTIPSTSSSQGTSITLSTAGTYTIKYFSVDNAGNSESVKTANNLVKIDKTAPITTDNTNSSWHTSSVTITLTCTDNNSGCDKTYYTIDGSTPTTSSTQGTSISLTSDGTYTIKYFSVDNVTNQETVKTASNSVKIDQSVPINLSLSSPTGYTKDNTKPTLVFKKSTDLGSGLSSYSVSLDSGKNRSFSSSGIPINGNGSSSDYVWKDDSSVKIEFLNENDSDSTNDEIHVYFKDLDKQELTEGKHTWTVTVTDTAGNSTSKSADFYLDRTSPSISELAIANISTVQSGKTYNLSILNRMPSFSGLATDSYQGSTVTNSNGTKDIFDKVSSGPQTLNLTFKKQKSDKTYTDYLTKDFSLSDIQDTAGDKKSSRFYVTTPYPLVDGYYQVQLTLKDGVGNTYNQPVFYVSLNTGVIGQLQNLIDNNGNLETKITKTEEIPVKTEEEKQQVKENGYIVKIKVVDTQNKPITGAKVTIHSKVQETITDKNGIALFNSVEPGQHKILIAYANYAGEQSVNLTGEVKEFDLNIQVKQTNAFLNPQVISVIGIMAFIILVTVVLLIKARKNKA